MHWKSLPNTYITMSTILCPELRGATSFFYLGNIVHIDFNSDDKTAYIINEA